MLRTLGAPERRLWRRRGRPVEEAEPAPVPTSRATLVRPRPFADDEAAQSWLAATRADRAEAELAAAVRRLNRALHAHRVSAADPYTAEVSPDRALVVRIGYGSGEEVAEGRFAAGWELQARGARTKRSMETPEERFAAILAGRERALAAEELVLRARADLAAGRDREAALQARVALESLVAELGTGEGRAEEDRGELEARRGAVGAAANAALRGELDPQFREGVAAAVERMEAALKRVRLGG